MSMTRDTTHDGDTDNQKPLRNLEEGDKLRDMSGKTSKVLETDILNKEGKEGILLEYNGQKSFFTVEYLEKSAAEVYEN